MISPRAIARSVSLLLLSATSATALAQEYSSRTQLPVSFGLGLEHPLPIAAARGELALSSGDRFDSFGLLAQAEKPLRSFRVDTLNFSLSGQGSLLVQRNDGPGDAYTLSSGRGGAKLTLPIPQVTGLWAGASLNAAYSRAEDESDSDLFAVLSTRYQAPKEMLGQALDFYGSLSLGADGPADTGFLFGMAVPLVNNMVAGVELVTENDRLTGYLGIPLQKNMRLTGALGVADGVDLIAQAQLTLFLD